MLKRLPALLLAFCVLLFSLTGCGDDGGNKTLNYISLGPMRSFDPQFATEENAKLLLHNIMEGLVVCLPDGTIQHGVAESYTVSPDGRTYTFTLREGLSWKDGRKNGDMEGAPLTAADFVFAIHRLFDPQAPSPYAGDFSCLVGAQALLAGEQAELGVYAPDERTVVFELTEPNLFFLELLASTAALPCNEAFFRETRGKYGLDYDYLLCNGPFRLYWVEENQYAMIRRNNRYYDPESVLPQGVNLHFTTDSTPYDKLRAGNVDLAMVSYEQLQTLVEEGYQYDGFDNTVWLLTFNQSEPFLQNEKVRAAIHGSVDQTALQPVLEDNFQATDALIPPSVLLGDSSYRALSGREIGGDYHPEQAQAQLVQALEELELRQLPTLTLAVQEQKSQLLAAGIVQGQLQQNLSLFVNVRPVPQEEWESFLRTGEYDLAIQSLTAGTTAPVTYLRQFLAGSSGSFAGIGGDGYASLLERLSQESDKQTLTAEIAQAEQMLLDTHMLVPLYFETTYIAFSPDASGFSISSDRSQIYFKGVRKFD